MAANPQTKPTDLGCESADRMLSSADTITIYYYYSARKLILILPSHRGWKAESTDRHCSKGAQPVPKAVYRSARLAAVRFEPGSSRIAVGRPTTKPPRTFMIATANYLQIYATIYVIDFVH